ncbi:acyl-CoA dehydrogenase family protein [Deltaproteobacteria bacterium TL4]
MMLLNPKNEKFEHLDEASAKLLKKVVAFFEDRGKAKLKADDHAALWYSDFLDFQKREKLFATFLTPSSYGKNNSRWDTYRNCQLNEILGFYGLSYWYTWQVTILGLGPLWMSKNEELKKKTAQLLQDGSIFAFGLSEKEHGADIYSSSMLLTPDGTGQYKANGEKYYIGNGNEAALVSTFAKMSDTGDYVFFAVESQHKNYECVKNVVHSQNYVAEYRLKDYPILEKDILQKGREAWDASLNTINVGKFNLGWASIGICTHAFYEALNHAAHRRLFDKYVTEFVHIKQLFVDAYTRLVAMKLFASRSADYMRAASPEDRRYLLYNPMVKMKVTTQGEEVINLLWDVIAAKGFEADMYFEMAVKDIRALPKLEGTVHVNMALIIKFMANYFFKPGKFPEISKMDQPVNDDFLFNQGLTKGLSKIKFHAYKKAYNSKSLPNLNIFKNQIKTLKLFLVVAKPDKKQIEDIDFLLNLGELFTLVVYGQLIIENAAILQVEDDLLDQIFDFMIRDFSKYALQLYSKTSSTLAQRNLCKYMISKPATDIDRYHRVLEKHVYSLTDQYTMNA